MAQLADEPAAAYRALDRDCISEASDRGTGRDFPPQLGIKYTGFFKKWEKREGRASESVKFVMVQN